MVLKRNLLSKFVWIIILLKDFFLCHVWYSSWYSFDKSYSYLSTFNCTWPQPCHLYIFCSFLDDHSRVRLKRNGIDYINANLVESPPANRFYILTQVLLVLGSFVSDGSAYRLFRSDQQPLYFVFTSLFIFLWIKISKGHIQDDSFCTLQYIST